VALQEEERSLTDAKLEMLFPSVPWRDPIRISDFDGDFGCSPAASASPVMASETVTYRAYQ